MRTRKSNKKYLLAGGVIAAIAASSGAFTASIGVDDVDELVGANEVTVEGGQILDVDYTLATSAGVTTVETVTLNFAGIYPHDPETYFRLAVDGVDFTCPSGNGWTFENSDQNPDASWTAADHDATVVDCTGSVDAGAATNETHIVVHAEMPPATYQDNTP